MSIEFQHPVYGGWTTNSNIYYGPNKVRGIYYGTKLVHPSPMSYSTNFKFGQTSSISLESASSSVFKNVNHDSIELRVQQDGIVGPSSTTSDWTYTPYAYLKQPFNKYEISVSVTVYDNLSSDKSGIVIGRPLSGENYTTLEFKSGWCWILNGTGRDGRAGWDITSKVVPVKGDVVTLSREWSGTNTRFRVLINGVEKVNINTTMVAASDANRNVAGLFVQHRRQSWSNYYGARLTNFEAHTF